MRAGFAVESKQAPANFLSRDTTIASTGCRRGEALALRWSDVDLDKGRASFSRSLGWVKKQPTFTDPKSTASNRVVPLPAQTVLVLKEQRKRQAAERLAAGDGALPDLLPALGLPERVRTDERQRQTPMEDAQGQDLFPPEEPEDDEPWRTRPAE